MVWGFTGWTGVGKLIEVQGKMDAEQDCEIFEEEVEESFETLEMAEDGCYFQQDNDPKHTSKKADQWFSDNNITPLKWPAQSPDLNPIGHLWQHLKIKLQQYDTPPKGVHDLWDRVANEWNEIPPETCQTLIERMPRTIQAVLKAKGGHTKYQMIK